MDEILSTAPRESSPRIPDDAPSCPDQVLCLDFAGTDLAILGALLDVLNEFLFLVL